MGKIYKNQTALRITLETYITLVSATTTLIKYKKPSGATGNWIATVAGSTIYYDIGSSADLDEDGTWTMWSHITFTGGTVVPGEPATVKVYIEGK